MSSSINQIQKTIEILNGVDYSKYGRAKNYVEYFEQSHADEKKLIQPILFRKFLEQVLGFELGQTIWAEEGEEGNIPDFVPVDTFTHPFIFDTKSTSDSEATLKKHLPQIRRYIGAYRVQYGVLTNMRELDVYTNESKGELPQFDFSFMTLYREYKSNPKNILETENTKKFVLLVEFFLSRTLTAKDKVNRIVHSAGWIGNERLNVDHLTTKLRWIVESFEHDALSQKNVVQLFPDQNPELAKNISQEIDFIGKEIDPTRADDIREIQPNSVNDFFNADSNTSEAKAANIFFYRVAYFAMARILLVRMWEDIEFIESTLTDGGFERWYKNLGSEIGRVLRQAFHFAGEKYEWLYKAENNYTWYEPSEAILIDALYELSNFYLGALKDDALGMIYEQELDKVDKQNKGQYYTERPVVKFMWDRVGYTNNKAFFREENKKLVPRKVFDPATGSGGFLVEAARRLRELSSPKEKSFDDWLLLRQTIFFGLYGVELSPFPYYITEINLLIQLTPVIRELKARKQVYKERTPIAVIQGDSLRLFNQPTELFVKEETKSYNAINHSVRFGHDSGKQSIYDKMLSLNDFDYCLANPPYIREDDHKELFRRTKALPIGRALYQGKMDYYHFFIELGLSKLREGGKLCFITTSYWLTAVGASNLRKYILDFALIKEVIDFADTKLFESAKGQFNVVFVLEKCSDSIKSAKKQKNVIKVARVKKELVPTIQENVPKLFRHLSEHIDEQSFSDSFIDVYDSGVTQGELTESEWHLFITKKQKTILDKIEKKSQLLENFCSINQGLLSGADAVTKENIKLLPQALINEHDIKIGQGIFYITDEEEKNLRLDGNEKELVKFVYKASEIVCYLATNEIQKKLLCIYVNKDTPVKSFPKIFRHLQKYKPILENKREAQEGKLPWYSMHWARTKDLFEGEKIVVSKWPARNDFGYSNADYYSDANTYLIKQKNTTTENLKYILGILNSKLIQFYFECRGSRRGDKFFFPKEFCEKLPIKPIKTKEEQKIHDKIVSLVNEMISERKKLLQLTQFISDKQFLNQKYFDELIPEFDETGIVRSLGWGAARPIKQNDAIKYSLGSIEPENFILNKVQQQGETLFEKQNSIRLVATDGSVVELKANLKIVELLKLLLADYRGHSLKEILEEVELPLKTDTLKKKKKEIGSEIKSVTKKITQIQNKIDDLAMELYEVKL